MNIDEYVEALLYSHGMIRVVREQLDGTAPDARKSIFITGTELADGVVMFHHGDLVNTKKGCSLIGSLDNPVIPYNDLCNRVHEDAYREVQRTLGGYFQPTTGMCPISEELGQPLLVHLVYKEPGWDDETVGAGGNRLEETVYNEPDLGLFDFFTIGLLRKMGFPSYVPAVLLKGVGNATSDSGVTLSCLVQKAIPNGPTTSRRDGHRMCPEFFERFTGQMFLAGLVRGGHSGSFLQTVSEEDLQTYDQCFERWDALYNVSEAEPSLMHT